MGKATQDGRLLKLATPLGKDKLLADNFSCTEAISELYEITVEMLYEEDFEDVYKFTELDMTKIMGQRGVLEVVQEDGGGRLFAGIFRQFANIGREKMFSKYRGTIVPHVWTLTQKSGNKVFQHISVPDILREVLDGFEFRLELQRQYEKRNYCVQYQESDFDFISRLMEEEGIYYYFEHTAETEIMVLRDNYKNPEDCPGKAEIPVFDAEQLGSSQWESSIGDFFFDHELSSGKYTFWDHNFQLPTKKLDTETQSRFNIGNNRELEVFKYPGGYARKYDGIDKTGGSQEGELQHIFTDNKNTAETQMLSMDSDHKIMHAISNCASLTAGYRYRVVKHPNDDTNGAYILTKIEHNASQHPAYVLGTDSGESYKAKISCIPHGSGQPEFKPALKTPKPTITGSQTAYVVGPAGEEIFTDKYGRVKVQFHWDRHGKMDAGSSCWMRVQQPWAGNKFGTMFIPRVGMEVVVGFLNGDPDQPYIIGALYNPQTMPPYELPAEKTKATIKTDSSKGGGGFNELRFEDKKDEEQIFIHGEKDLDVRIKNDAKEFIGNDRHLIIKKKQFEEVKEDKHLKVKGNHNEEVVGTTSLTTQNLQQKVKQNFALQADSEAHLKGNSNLVLESNTSVTIKAGGSFIQLSSAGIFIKGTMVYINSGGAAGSGMGVSATGPEEPKEADNAEAGTTVEAKKAPPPPKPDKVTTPMAAVLSDASSEGTPFCAVC